MFNRILHLVRKELLAILKDPRSRFILVGPPLIQLLIFSSAATLEVKNVSLGIYTEDHGATARALLARFHAAHRTFGMVRHYDSLVALRRAVDDQEILAALHIGPEFSKHLASGSAERVQVILDGRKANSALIVQGYIRNIVARFPAETTADKAAGGRAKNRLRGSIVPRFWFNPNLDPKWSTVAALLGILCNLVVLLTTSLSVARERELGTFEQLLVSPLRPIEILIGKSVPAMILGILEGLFMISMAVFIFALPLTWKGFVLLLGTICVFVFSVVGVGLLISSLSVTQQQAFLGAFTYQVPATLLCGFATPVDNIPDWLRWLAYINPQQYMVTVSRSIFMENPSAHLVASLAWPLIPIGVVTLTAAGMLFRSRME